MTTPDSVQILFNKSLQIESVDDDNGILQDIKCIDLDTEEDNSQITGTGLKTRSSDDLQSSDPDAFVSLLPQEIWLMKIFQEFSPHELCNIG